MKRSYTLAVFILATLHHGTQKADALPIFWGATMAHIAQISASRSPAVESYFLYIVMPFAAAIMTPKASSIAIEDLKKRDMRIKNTLYAYIATKAMNEKDIITGFATAVPAMFMAYWL